MIQFLILGHDSNFTRNHESLEKKKFYLMNSEIIWKLNLVKFRIYKSTKKFHCLRRKVKKKWEKFNNFSWLNE